MESNATILARCAGCDRNFETRHYGQQTCPICRAQVFVPQPAGGSSDDSLPPPGEMLSEPPPRESADQHIENNQNTPPWNNKFETNTDGGLPEFVPAVESGTHGYIGGFIQTIKEIISSPAAFFIRVRVGKAGIWSAVVFGSIICTIALDFSILFLLLLINHDQQASLTALSGKAIGMPPEQYLNLVNTVLSWTLYLSPLLGIINVLLCAGIYHAVVVATSSKNRGFGATVRATAYGFIPLLLFAIPYIGQLLGGMWTLALQVIALSQIHRMSPWRAALVVLLPTVALLLLFALPVLIRGPI